ncbi:TPA: hypothetical protein isoform 3 [Bos taurus]|nr:TPA: hypothetical protein isoform 1 [Bos taurus]DAA21441.1 TPA: hypothetical protein isoform 2 [Bos taurus]DAA21442.1 TPA: hypothetical protein isoform 3 [Bos taurus]
MSTSTRGSGLLQRRPRALLRPRSHLTWVVAVSFFLQAMESSYSGSTFLPDYCAAWTQGIQPVRFASLLQRTDGGTLELQVGFEILGDLPHQPLERQLPNQKMGGFLVRTDFSEGNGPGPVAMRFCHPAGRGGAFPGRFDDQLFAGHFPTRGFISCPLGPGHFL